MAGTSDNTKAVTAERKALMYRLIDKPLADAEERGWKAFQGRKRARRSETQIVTEFRRGGHTEFRRMVVEPEQ